MKKHMTTLLLLAAFMQALPGQTDTAGYEHRPFQFTFLFPPFSTNGIANVNIVNDVSLNLFLGVSGGVEVLEAGGFINIDRFYMNGVQLAGFGNTVGGQVSGLQLSGFYNVVGASVTGVQSAGFVNVVGASFTGVQAAGFACVTGGNTSGVQAAGFANVNGGEVEGLQAAGFINVAEEFRGAQLAGFMNLAGTVTGTQLSGFINICDSIDGVPLSFISIVKKNGYRNLGLSVSEVQYAAISLRMGVPRLYNIYSFGKPFGPGSRWMYGGGLGTEVPLSPGSVLNIEATVHQELWIAPPGIRHFLYIDRLNLYSSAKFLLGWKVDDHLSLHAGPTINAGVSHSNSEIGQLAHYEIPPYSFYSRTGQNFRETSFRMWIGVEGGIRF